MNKKDCELKELQENLQLLHFKLRKQRVIERNRIDPFDELIFDRWEKAKFSNGQKGSSIYHNNYITGKIFIGEKTWVGPFTILDGGGAKLRIGKYCSISSGVQIYTHNTVKWALTAGKVKAETGKVTIGDCCYLGPYVVVGMGVIIGKNSIIGAHSFVNSDIPANSIAYGIPAKVIGKVKVKGKNVVVNYFKKNKSIYSKYKKSS